jgi:hypothetical protein
MVEGSPVQLGGRSVKNSHFADVYGPESAVGGHWGGSCVLQFYCSRGVILLQGGYATRARFGGWGEGSCARCW